MQVDLFREKKHSKKTNAYSMQHMQPAILLNHAGCLISFLRGAVNNLAVRKPCMQYYQNIRAYVVKL